MDSSGLLFDVSCFFEMVSDLNYVETLSISDGNEESDPIWILHVFATSRGHESCYPIVPEVEVRTSKNLCTNIRNRESILHHLKTHCLLMKRLSRI